MTLICSQLVEATWVVVATRRVNAMTSTLSVQSVLASVAATSSNATTPAVRTDQQNAYLSINQSKFIFQIITEKNYNVVALERLPEKHYAH